MEEGDDENAYELERQKTIAANQALLASLGLNDFTSTSTPKDSAATSSRASSNAGSKRKAGAGVNGNGAGGSDRDGSKRKKRSDGVAEKVVPQVGTRKSMRVRGMEAKTEEDVQKYEEFNLEQELEKEKLKLEARKVRKPVMDIGEMIDDDKYGGEKKIETLRSTLQSLSLNSYPRPPPPTPSTSTSKPTSIDPSDAPNAKSDDTLRKHFNKVRFIQEVKVTSERGYTIVVHPEREKCLVFQGDKRGAIGIWDAFEPVKEYTDEDGETYMGSQVDNVWHVQAHQTNSVSRLQFDPVDAQYLYSSAYDCSIRRLSLHTGQTQEIFAYPNADAITTWFDFVPQTRDEIWLTDSEGGVGFLDLREGKGVRRRWDVSSNVKGSLGGRKVGTIAVNPIQPYLLATGHNDRHMRIWDARKFDAIKAESIITPKSDPTGPPPAHDPSTYPTLNSSADIVDEYRASKAGKSMLKAAGPHALSCSSAFWDIYGKKVLTSSYDDHLRAYNVDPADYEKDTGDVKTPSLFWRVSHNCNVGRWVSIFRAIWSPYEDLPQHVLVGDMARRSTIRSGLTGQSIMYLGYPGLNTVPAVNAFHPNRPGTIVGGQAGGKVLLWTIPEGQT